MLSQLSSRLKNRREQQFRARMQKVREVTRTLRKPEQLVELETCLKTVMQDCYANDDDRKIIREAVVAIDRLWRDAVQFCQLAPSRVLMEIRNRDLLWVNASIHQLVALASHVHANTLESSDLMSPALEDFFMRGFWSNGAPVVTARMSQAHFQTLAAPTFLKILLVEGYVEVDGNYVLLTSKGQAHARRLAATYFYRRNMIRRWLVNNSTTGFKALLGWIGSGAVGIGLGHMLS